MQIIDRVDRVDESLFDTVVTGGTSRSDRRSLLALHACLAQRGAFDYLEIGSYMGASMQSMIADPRCRRIVSIDRRDAQSADERQDGATYPSNTTARMLETLAEVPGAELEKLTTIDASVDELDATKLKADLCFVDAEHTNAAALRDALFCREVIRNRGVIVFHDRTLVDRGIRKFLKEVKSYRAYPLAHDLFVVEIGVPSLLTDPRVRRVLSRRQWLWLSRRGVVGPALALGAGMRRWTAAIGKGLLAIGEVTSLPAATEPRSERQVPQTFEVQTFVTDEALYERMRKSFVAAGFAPDAFVRLSDADDNPYLAINRVGRRAGASYVILCHQDVIADQGMGAGELLDELRYLSEVDPNWRVAGNAGIGPDGALFRRVSDVFGSHSIGDVPAAVVSLDENFLVFNPWHKVECSADLSGFHLYGTDVCLHAIRAAGSAYVIDFPLTHARLGDRERQAARNFPYSDTYWTSFEVAKANFRRAWNQKYFFRYVLTINAGTLFVSRSKLFRAIFGSSLAISCVDRGLASRH